MSLRILAVMVMLLTAVGLGLIAFETTRGPHPGAEHAAKAVPTELVLVATHPLPAGTLARDTDFVAHSIPVGTAPAGVILAAPGATGGIRGALVRRYIDAGTPVLTQDILRPRDRGFLAAVLTPGMRAISVGVNAVTGVSGLIWPGDHVDVLLTQKDNARSTPLAERVFSETVLKNVRVIAIDQKIVQGASGSPADTAAAAQAKVYRTVTIEVTPRESEKVAVAEQLGPLSLAVRPMQELLAMAQAEPSSTVFASMVSPALARAQKPVGARMNIIQGNTRQQVTFP